MGFALSWDAVGERLYETGVSHGVLYPMKDTITDPTDPYDKGVAWNGLSAVTAGGEGGEPNPVYADDIKYLNIMSAEEATLSIEAYTYPDEFEECDGSRSIATGVTIGQQPRRQFGFSYQTLIGNDVKSNDYGYKIHLVYGCIAGVGERSYQTVNDSPEAITISWDISTTPVDVPGFKPTATLTVDSTKTAAAKIDALKAILYGTDGTSAKQPRLPLPAEVITTLT